MTVAETQKRRATSFTQDEMLDLWPHVIRQAVADARLTKNAKHRASARAFLKRIGILSQAESVSTRRLRSAFYPRSGQWQRRPGFESIDESVIGGKIDRRRAGVAT